MVNQQLDDKPFQALDPQGTLPPAARAYAGAERRVGERLAGAMAALEGKRRSRIDVGSDVPGGGAA